MEKICRPIFVFFFIVRSVVLANEDGPMRCISPVVCAVGKQTRADWIRVFPNRACEFRGQTTHNGSVGGVDESKVIELSGHISRLEREDEKTKQSLDDVKVKLHNAEEGIYSLENSIAMLNESSMTADNKIYSLKNTVALLNERLQQAEDKIDSLERSNVLLNKTLQDGANLGTYSTPAANCSEIKRAVPSSKNGLFNIRDNEGNVFLTYCDMITAGGGWTLIASVHENNLKGKCTAGDRWSSEQGDSAAHPHGDGFWENRAIHGAASSATSDDYKNSGYFAMTASDVMLWQVPNDTPLIDFESQAFLKYHTTNGFLRNYGGNLQALFSRYYPMKSKQFTRPSDNGPAIPVTWDRGNNEELRSLTPANIRTQTDPGYIQFRVLNKEQNAFALCPGLKMQSGFGDVEHVCVGSTSNNLGSADQENYCGDFAAKDWPDDEPGWASTAKIIESTIMIFYR